MDQMSVPMLQERKTKYNWNSNIKDKKKSTNKLLETEKEIWDIYILVFSK